MFRGFLKGRYGMDSLTFVILAFSLIFIGRKYVWVLGVILIIWAIFRVLSKDYEKRNHELQVFNNIFQKIAQSLMKATYSLRNKYYSYKSRQQQKSHYVFLKCPKCRNKLRLPINKGKLMVTCPVCKYEFIKET
jgi:ribosomal protein S27E